MWHGFLNDDLREQRLIERIKNGDRNAFELLIDPYSKALCNYILFRVKNDFDVNDIVQEAMLSIWRSITSYNYQSSFKTWAFSILRRRLVDFYRINSKNEALPLTDFENVFTAKDNLNESIERMDIERALSNLNSDDNELVYLVFQVQLSYQEISVLLGIPVGTVKSRMSRIKTKLKTLLREEINMDNIPVKEIGALLDEVSDKVPKLITGLLDTIYSAEAGQKMGKSVGNLYRELVDSGIPQEEATKMAKDYMLSMKDMVGNMTQNSGNKALIGGQKNCANQQESE